MIYVTLTNAENYQLSFKSQKLHGVILNWCFKFTNANKSKIQVKKS